MIVGVGGSAVAGRSWDESLVIVIVPSLLLCAHGVIVTGWAGAGVVDRCWW